MARVERSAPIHFKEAIVALLWFLIVGLVVGLIARALMPGNQQMGIVMTILLGVGGSFVGGFLVSLFTSNRITDFNTTGLIGSIIGAIVLMVVVGGLTRVAKR